MNGPCQSCYQPAQDGSRWCRACDPAPRIMREIAERQANPLNEDYEAWRRSLVARG